jgi:YVTN family beta-propeller protein
VSFTTYTNSVNLIISTSIIFTIFSLFNSATIIYSQETQTINKNSNSTDFIPYENKELGIKILYPADSTLSDSNLFGDDIKISLLEKSHQSNQSNVSPEIKISVSQSPALNVLPSTLDKFSEQISNIMNATVIEKGNLEISKVPFKKHILTFDTFSNEKVKALNLQGLLNNYTYLIEYDSDPKTFDEYLPIAEKIIQSFSIINKPNMTDDNGLKLFKTDNPAFLKFVNSKNHLEMNVPSDALITAGSNSLFSTGEGVNTIIFPQSAFKNVDLNLTDPSSLFANKDMAFITLQQFGVTDFNTPPDKALEKASSALSNNTNLELLQLFPNYNYKILSTDKNYNFQNNKAIKTILSATPLESKNIQQSKKPNIQIMSIVTEINNRIYLITFTSAEESFNKYLPTVEKMFSSLKDTNRFGVISSINLPNPEIGFYMIYEFVFNPDNNMIYASQSNLNDLDVKNVLVIDPTTKEIITNITLPELPDVITYDPNTKMIYVLSDTFDYISRTLSIIDPKTNKIIDNIQVTPYARAIAFNHNEKLMYIANSAGSDSQTGDSNTISVIDTATMKNITHIPVGEEPIDIRYNPDNEYLYVANFGSGSVSVIDSKTNKVITDIKVRDEPRGIAFNHDDKLMYVFYDSPIISVIDISTNQVVKEIEMEDRVSALEYNPSNQLVYTRVFESYITSNLNIYDPKTDETVFQIPIDGDSKQIFYEPVNNNVYIGTNRGILVIGENQSIQK